MGKAAAPHGFVRAPAVVVTAPVRAAAARAALKILDVDELQKRRCIFREAAAAAVPVAGPEARRAKYILNGGRTSEDHQRQPPAALELFKEGNAGKGQDVYKRQKENLQMNTNVHTHHPTHAG